mgnify:CR=1 FL=1
MSDLTRLSAAEQSALLESREISSVELTKAHLDRIAETAGANSAAFAQFQRDLPTLIKHAK